MTESSDSAPSGITRASLLARGALAAGAAYGMASVGPFVARSLAQSGGGDRAIIEFALELERLEATFYGRALKEVPDLSASTQPVVATIYDDEQQHAQVLQGVDQQQGGTPGPVPNFNYGDAFSSEARFLAVAQLFEDTGVAAYNGAAPLLSVKQTLIAAGTIVQVEGRHAAVIRSLRGQPIAPSPFDTGRTAQQVEGTLRPYLAGATSA